MHGTIETALKRSIPLFGVCLGLQGLIEDYGGELQELDYPMQSKQSTVSHDGSGIFAGIEETFNAGRYHSLVAKTVPLCLRVTARTEDGKVMAIQPNSLSIHTVLFHPKSIMSLQDSAGHTLIRNVVKLVARGCSIKQAS